MKKKFLFFLMILSVSANAQTLVLAGDNHLTLDGERFNNKKILFTKAEGDWFTKENDAHGTITFYATYDNRQLLIQLEWDGKEPTPITDETRHKQRVGEFMMTLPDMNEMIRDLNGTLLPFGWVLEDNQGMMSIAQLPGAGINHTYRIYQKAL